MDFDMNDIIRTERGWPGHFICADECLFRRNTLLEKGEERIVVSTVGLMRNRDGSFETLGYNRYYETMAFKASWQDPYWEADTSNQLDFNSNWCLNETERESDKKANDMHEDVVNEFIHSLST